MKRNAFGFVSVFIVLGGLACSDPRLGQTPPPNRDLVVRAIQAMGGEDALRGLVRVRLRGDVQQWEPTQTYMPGGDARPTGESALIISRDFTQDATRIDWDRRLVYPTVRHYQFSEILAGGIGYVHGVDSTVRLARTFKTEPPGYAMSGLRVATTRRELTRTSPRFLLDLLADPQRLAEFTVTFDPETDLPARVRVLDSDTIEGDSTSDVVFGDWRDEAGVKFPRLVTYELNGREVARYQFTEITVNPSLTSDAFAMPAEARTTARPVATESVPYQWMLRRQYMGVLMDSDPVNYDADAVSGLRLVEVAPGIQHAVGGTHNSLIVEMNDHLIVFDAPMNEWQSTWTINAAKAKYPGKPIKHLVLTHHHSDHAGGARTYVAEGASVVVGAPAEALFARVFAAPHTVDHDRLQQSPRVAEIVEVSDQISLTDGTREVKLYRIENRHAEGMLIAQVLDARVGFVTDLWSPVRDPIPSPSAVDLLATAKALRIDPATRFAGGHGGVAPVTELERIVNKR
jgi:glyoxylase-like metal-dependent hydrolase (beta-lactamase superfamily II)